MSYQEAVARASEPVVEENKIRMFYCPLQNITMFELAMCIPLLNASHGSACSTARTHKGSPSIELSMSHWAALEAIKVKRHWRYEDNKVSMNPGQTIAFCNATGTVVPDFVKTLFENWDAPFVKPTDDTCVAMDLVEAERTRQITKGYDAKHDDTHSISDMILAAEVFVNMAHSNDESGSGGWPFSDKKPVNKGRTECLIRAGAMILAALEHEMRSSSIQDVK